MVVMMVVVVMVVVVVSSSSGLTSLFSLAAVAAEGMMAARSGSFKTALVAGTGVLA